MWPPPAREAARTLMRRTIAISLLFLFGWLPMAPLFVSSAETNLPPCCRRHGRHHCAMQRLLAMAGKLGGPTAFEERCPFAGKSDAQAGMRLPRPAAESVLVFAIAVEDAIAFQSMARRDFLFFNDPPQRGPPELTI